MDFKSGDEAAMGLDLDTQDTVDDTAPVKNSAKAQKAVAMENEDKGSEALVAEAAGAAMAGAMAEVAKAASEKEDSKKVLDRRFRLGSVRQGDVAHCRVPSSVEALN